MIRQRLVLLALALGLGACSNPASPVAPDPTAPAASGAAVSPAAPAPGDDGVNFASPPDPSGGGDGSRADAAAAADPQLAARVRERFGEGCRLEHVCGDLAGVDCGAAVDGPYYSVRRRDLERVAGCGGLCMSGKCTNCPPPEWTCPTY